MTVDEALVRARELIEPFKVDLRRAFITDALVCGADPDDLDRRVAIDDALFDDWCQQVLDGMRAELTEFLAEGNES